MTGKHYYWYDDVNDLHFLREPEFCLQSRRPGIASDFFHKYKSDMDKGFITLHGKQMPLPKYYNYLMEDVDPVQAQIHKDEREAKAKALKSERTDERLSVKHQIALKKTKKLTRKL